MGTWKIYCLSDFPMRSTGLLAAVTLPDTPRRELTRFVAATWCLLTTELSFSVLIDSSLDLVFYATYNF